MLDLENKITLNAETIKAANLCDRFTEDDLRRIGAEVYTGYRIDKGSRSKWERRSEAAMDLALQIQKDKNFPWPNCSNIAFPLVTIATLQFSSRAYAAIVDGPEIVKCRVNGEDPTNEKTLRADRVSTHMSWQVMEEDKAWEEQHDRLLINIPVVGTAFIKSYRDFSKGHNSSELVLARDLVLSYFSKSVEECPRKTQCIPLFRNEIHEKVLRGTFRDVLEEAWFKQPASPPAAEKASGKDNRQGVVQPQSDMTSSFSGLEQHVQMDLDKDGYAEPYIITIEETSQAVLRIVCGFDREIDIERVQVGKRKGEIIKINAMQYYTKYGFVPSPDGGIYDVGFGVLLGPLNETVNSNINQLVDAGTMSNTAGGFLGRGAKIRGGVYTFAPFAWNRVDSTGDDLSKSIFPLPVREPSAVLFQLLVLLINYTNRVSGSTDVLVGENPGQNQPAETTRTVVDQGLKIYSAIFKRIWRAMKEEFKKLYQLNGIYMPATQNFGSGQKASREDYLGDPDAIAPSADPNVSSDQMQFAQAQAVKAAAMQTPGYDPVAVERMFLKALKVPGIDKIYPGPDKIPAGKSEKITIQEMKMQIEQAKLQSAQAQFAAELMEQQRVNNAQITELQAKAFKEVSDVQGDQRDREINAVNAMIGLLKHRNDLLGGQIDRILKTIELDKQDTETGTKHGTHGRRLLELVAGSGDQGAPGEGTPGLATGAT